ncbi:MAG: glycoside hydrolase family 38 C-terminal domain-containing protein, partial [Bacteroidota bacterium]
MKNTFLTLLLSVFCVTTFAQSTTFISDNIINGFAKKISGNDLTYHSSIPLAKECLITRANNGNSSMEWETAAVPLKFKGAYATFVWVAGLGSSPGRARFDLQVNGEDKFSFWADGLNQWEVQAEDGSLLSFQTEMIDQNDDRFGLMHLKVPKELVNKGEPLTLKVTGGKFGKTSWYMTFKFPLLSGLNLRALPAIIEENGKQSQLGSAGILHFGEPAKAQIFINRRLVKETTVKYGYNNVKVGLPTVKQSKEISYKLVIGNLVDKGKLTLNPVKQWRVNFVQHSHTDIGYTRSQTEILAEHLRFIDYALDYCDNTDDYPDDAKFRWTCEATWPVDEYLKSRPAKQIERLKQRVKEGRIELAGMYFNFNELPDEQILAASLKPLKNIKRHGLDVKVAMQNDVNGIGWCLNDYYNDLGIKYLNMGTHGHRALICFDKPTLFWWESPSGKRMLAYRAEHYMTGNTVFNIHGEDFNRFEDELLTYLINLEAKGYNYDLISIQHSGYLTDNAPPSTLASGMIREWNEKYHWPKLKTATATEFFVEMEKNYGDEFQVIRGAWPDWWTDGFGASAREVAATRRAQTDLIANTSALTMAALQGSRLPEKTGDQIEEANNALLFYTEHTVGYHGSVREPFHKNTMEQRALKESYAWEASRRAKMLGEVAMGLLQSHVQREEEPSILVYNSLNWKRSGLFTIYVDHQIIPRYAKFSIKDKSGHSAFAQAIEHHSDGTYWTVWVDDIPAFGFKKYLIQIEEDQPEKRKHTEGLEISELENQWYKVIIDKEKGAISGLFDKELRKELVDQNAEWKLGEFIYETLGNREQMEAFKLDNFKREPLDKVWLESFEEGAVWNTIRFTGNTAAASRDGAYTFEIRLFNTAKRIDLAYFIEKKMVTDPEGIYVAFPFILENGELAFDVQGGEVRAGIDQIPGSTNDWNTVQNYARLSNENSQVMLSSPDIPLMQFGAINTGRYKAGATPESTHIYGWPMNNYWTTNFNAEQHGGIEWAYHISSSSNQSQMEATQFGWSIRVPFLTRVLPGGGQGGQNWEESIIQGWSDNILVVSSKAETNDHAATFHVREIDGKVTSLKLKNGISGEILKLKQVNVLGEEIENGSVQMAPYESKFFKIEF